MSSSKNGSKYNVEKPLKGTVLCCTSVAPEQRTHMAEAAIQMGAEHNLDLTSDVTHLIVGDTNTVKYKYVAKEREDIKVVQLQWVEAVRQAWMQGGDVNLAALEEEYRLPTLANLRISVTGFEDLTFRAQLQEAISDNGGEYRGDLTKEVTHLIAYAPEGKKYQYATQWEVKVVGLKWLEDSLARRMILEEALYHPNIPQDEQGAGAWKRQPRPDVQLGKRTRADEDVPDVPRKLRRTASMKLGSQRETLWCEIVNGPPGEDSANDDQLRPSKSLPILNSVALEPKSFTTDTTGTEDDRRRVVTTNSNMTEPQQGGNGIFAHLGFYLYAFTSKQTSILQEHILSNDGQLFQTLSSQDQTTASHLGRLFLIVPHCHPFSDIPSVEHLDRPPEVVSDMWVERCLQSKRFFEPDEHVLSRPVRKFPLPGFERLLINSTGLANIDLLHVSKVVKLLGATYDQILKSDISILLCNPNKAGEDKLRHARQWHIPAVSIEWLWACICSGRMESFRPFLLKQAPNSGPVTAGSKAVVSDRAFEARGIEGEHPMTSGQKLRSAYLSEESVHEDSLPKISESRQNFGKQRAKLIPGEGFMKSPPRGENDNELRDDKTVVATELAAANTCEPRQAGNNDDHEARVSIPLQEISENSMPESERSASPRKAGLFCKFEGQPRVPDRLPHDDTPSAPQASRTGKAAYIPPRSESINVAIKELLGKTKAKDMKSATSNGETKPKRLLGRALSNMSNSSRESCTIRASRASSIDSVNTDGLGSIILDETSPTGCANAPSGNGGRSGFSGRASEQERGANGFASDLRDAALYREEYQEDEEPPQMSQLGYDNPEDAVALREMLAERRRNRTRTGQEDVKPPDSKEKRRVKDDSTLAQRGWSAGRRTRQMAKSP